MPEEPEKEAATEMPLNYMMLIVIGIVIVAIVGAVVWMIWSGHSPQSLLCAVLYRIPGMLVAVGSRGGSCA